MSPQKSVPRSDGLRSRWHALAHLLLLVAGWVIFALSWWKVLGDTWDTAGLKQLIIGAVIVVPAVTGAWIRHNLRIHRRLGPRRGLRAVPMRYETDFNGRRIVADWDELQHARHIVIERGQDTKRYVAVRPGGASAAHEAPPSVGPATVL